MKGLNARQLSGIDVAGCEHSFDEAKVTLQVHSLNSFVKMVLREKIEQQAFAVARTL